MSYTEDDWHSDCVDLAYDLRLTLLEVYHIAVFDDELREKIEFQLMEAEIILDK